MDRKIRMCAVLVGLICVLTGAGRTAPRPVELKCEYREDPRGIEEAHPRLSWAIDAEGRGVRQNAYRVLVASSPDLLSPDEADMWDSNRVKSDRSLNVPYDGDPLRSGETYWWKVRAWTSAEATDGSSSSGYTDRASRWSEPARWSMGLLREDDWQADWIAHPKLPQKSGPMPIFRTEFRAEKEVERAVAYVSGLGQYEFFVNGTKVGRAVLQPAWSDYEEEVYYNVYDVTDSLRSGLNALGVMLGNGFFHVAGGRYTKYTGSFGRPRLICQLRLEFADGTEKLVPSGKEWRTTDGPVRFSSIYGGEDYDARRARDGWKEPGYDDSGWRAVARVEPPAGHMRAQASPPLTVKRKFEPQEITEPQPGVFVCDMGQNCSAMPRLRVKGKKGQTVRLTPAEQLHEDGTVNQAGVGSPSYMEYTLAGGGVESWRPQFFYTGYQYLQIEGAVPEGHSNPEEMPVVAGLQSHHVSSSAPIVGDFECSNELFNRIYELVDWAVRSNLQHVLTDCPHREKLGWLEVSYLMGPSIAYRYRIPALYSKVARDIRGAQLKNGLVPCIAPEYTVFDGGFRYTPAWASACIIDPWYMYRWYGDRRTLERHYPAMQRYLQYVKETSEDLIAKPGLGDWYDYLPGQRIGPSKLTSTKL
ncbi:MAG: family 78 glycoside hydrolase catalytic domain, partial [Planctomycetota bacterium]